MCDFVALTFFLTSTLFDRRPPGLSLSERAPPSEPRRLASLGSLLDDQHWHHLVMVWSSSDLNLTVDKHTETVQTPAEFAHRSVLEVGAHAPAVAPTP